MPRQLSRTLTATDALHTYHLFRLLPNRFRDGVIGGFLLGFRDCRCGLLSSNCCCQQKKNLKIKIPTQISANKNLNVLLFVIQYTCMAPFPSKTQISHQSAAVRFWTGRWFCTRSAGSHNVALGAVAVRESETLWLRVVFFFLYRFSSRVFSLLLTCSHGLPVEYCHVIAVKTIFAVSFVQCPCIRCVLNCSQGWHTSQCQKSVDNTSLKMC